MAKRQPERFDLLEAYSAQDQEYKNQLATLSDLIAELNKRESAENQRKVRGDQVTSIIYKNFDALLEFLHDAIGMPKPRNKDRIPVAALKIIKLLYVVNEQGIQDRSPINGRVVKGIHLFRILAPPHISGKPSLEFGFAKENTEEKDRVNVVKDLGLRIARQLDPKRLKLIDQYIFSVHDFLAKLSIEDERSLISVKNLYYNPKFFGFSQSASDTVQQIKNVEIPLAHNVSSIDEIFYLYLRCLEINHFVEGRPKVVSSATIRYGAACHHNEIKNFYTTQRNRAIAIKQNTTGEKGFLAKFSLDEIDEILRETHLDIVRLIGQSFNFLTGNAWPKEKAASFAKALAKDGEIIKMVLYISVIRGQHPDPFDDRTVLTRPLFNSRDLMSAICAIEHQRITKQETIPFSVGQVTLGKNPIKYLESVGSVEKLTGIVSPPHIVMLFWSSLFSEFYAWRSNTLQIHRFAVELNRVRLQKLVELLRTQNIDLIASQLQSLIRITDMIVQDNFPYPALLIAETELLKGLPELDETFPPEP